MKRYVAYLAAILLLSPLECTLPRLPLFHGIHVLLVVPLVYFMALEVNTIEGLLLSYVAGFVEDATVSYTPGLAAFSFVALFIVARVALVAVRADGPLFDALFCFVLAVCFYALTFALRRMFEPRLSPLEDGWWAPYLWASFTTAIAAPIVTAIGRRIEKLQVKSPGAT